MYGGVRPPATRRDSARLLGVPDARAPRRSRPRRPRRARPARAPACGRRAGVRADAARWPASMRARRQPSRARWSLDLANGRTLLALRADTPRIPASIEKLFTTSTALLALRPAGRLTHARARRRRARGRRHLARRPLPARRRRPDVRAASFNRRAYGSARRSPTWRRRRRRRDRARHRLRLRRRVVLRRAAAAGPSSGFALRPRHRRRRSAGCRSTAASQRAAARPSSAPGEFAADQLARALRAGGVAVPRPQRTGADAARARSSSRASPRRRWRRSSRLTQPSRPTTSSPRCCSRTLGARFGGERLDGRRGAAVVRGTLGASASARSARDGSGLSRGDRTHAARGRPPARPAGPHGHAGGAVRALARRRRRTGTLGGRMRGTAAAGRCRARPARSPTSRALAGYCDTSADRTIAFAILMNDVNVVRRSHASRTA